MSSAWDQRRITELRDWYKERVRRRLGEAFKVDMSLPVPAAQWLVRQAVTQAPRRIVEFGAGFSTLAFARALHAIPNCELVSLDHDTDWIKFVHECAKQKGAPMDRIRAMTTHEFLGSNQEPFDMVLVDHGPTYDVRIASIAPIVAMSRRVGCSTIVLDDWHKSKRKKNLYCEPVTRIAKQLGCSVHGIPESSTPSQQRELARLTLSEDVSPPAYVGAEKEYWEGRLQDTSLRAVGRRDASLETNREEYEKAADQFQDMMCHDLGGVDPKLISVLDLGFGHGHYQRLCEQVGVGRYHGIDFAAPPLSNLPDGYTTSVGDIGKPFDLQEKFSLVLGIDVLYHLVDDAAFSAAISNIRRHAQGWIYLTGLFHTSQTTPHVRHRPLDRYMSLGSLETITPWRDNRIGRFRV